MPDTYTHPSVLAGIAAGKDWADPEMDAAHTDMLRDQLDPKETP